MITIIDYGMGNLRSVSKALESLGASVRVTSDPREVAAASKLILPGVGAFPAAMRELASRHLIDPLKAALAAGIPYLGICLGLQLLFEESEEGSGSKGLGVLPGRVRRFASDPSTRPATAGLAPRPASHDRRGGQGRPESFDSAQDSALSEVERPEQGRKAASRDDGTGRLKVPHMGWNQITSRTPHAARSGSCPLLRDIPDASYMYFVHSYYAEPADRSVIALRSTYGIPFTAMVWRQHLYATQFHPEKSQAIGLKMLQNFIALT